MQLCMNKERIWFFRMEKYDRRVRMKKILPFEISMIETYHCDAFIMGIIQSYNSVKQLSLNYYINMHCVRSREMKKLDIQYVHSLWGDMW